MCHIDNLTGSFDVALEDAAADEEPAAVEDDDESDWFPEPHAAIDTAIATAKAAERVFPITFFIFLPPFIFALILA
jgi:hypothetical protein